MDIDLFTVFEAKAVPDSNGVETKKRVYSDISTNKKVEAVDQTTSSLTAQPTQAETPASTETKDESKPRGKLNP